MSKQKIQDHQLGFGVGLRNCHFDHILKHQPAVDWFEAISENFMDSGGRPRSVLRRIAENYPIVLHGVSLSIGSTDPLNLTYLQRLKSLANEIRARWVSDHLCWTGVLGINSHDLLPLPLNQDVLNHIIPRIHKVQEFLGRPLILENPSTYIRFRDSTLEEPQFLQELCQATDCQLLLDVNNVYVSCFNGGLCPETYLKNFPFESVVQFHLAGHQHCGTHIIDTHDQPVTEAVWELFRAAWPRTNSAATLVEWDGDVPEFERLHDEVLLAKKWINGTQDTSPNKFNIETTDIRSEKNSLSTSLNYRMPNVMATSHLETEV